MKRHSNGLEQGEGTTDACGSFLFNPCCAGIKADQSCELRILFGTGPAALKACPK